MQSQLLGEDSLQQDHPYQSGVSLPCTRDILFESSFFVLEWFSCQTSLKFGKKCPDMKIFMR